MRERLSATGSTPRPVRRAFGPSGRRRLAFVAVAMALALLGGTVVASPVAGQSSTIEARIVAQKLEDGRVEFGFQERARGGAWSDITLPRDRFFPTSATVDRWLASSPVLLGAHAGVPASTSQLRIVARKISDGRIEFALQHREIGDAWGDIQFPRSRLFPTTATVSRWLASSVLTLTIGPATRGSSGGGTAPPPPPPPPPPPTTEPTGPGSTAPYTAVSVSDFHSCGLHSDGAITCWGRNWAGQANAPDGEFSDVSAGNSHTCGLRADGTITCWGSSGSAQTNAPSGQFTDVAAGDVHSCGVRSDGTITCWGDNNSGQLDAPDGEFTAVTAGHGHTCGLRADETVDCWTFGGRANPPRGEFSAVSAGDAHSCGLQTDGTIVCWGNNLNLQTDVPDGEYTAVSAGRIHSCGLRTDGKVTCWGNPWYGQTTPPNATFTAVDAGDRHSCGVLTDGTMTCWGGNRYGQNDVPNG